MATEGPITIVLEVEEVLTLTTVIETFRLTTNTVGVDVPVEVKIALAGILKKMIREFEQQTMEKN